jgi:hypothetical protein
MQALIDFLGAYEPLYPQVVKGYPPEAIARLEHVLGRPVPAVYRVVRQQPLRPPLTSDWSAVQLNSVVIR